ncbi:MAG: Zn-dependent M28 family amino/carboxypeptidase, partial [Flavobacteriales bacterium]
TGENIVATQPGLEYPNQKYVICAHYDAMPTAIAPAADDDGSGTATLIELARVLSQYEFVFTIEYGFWDEEEQGLVGSREYAEAAALCSLFCLKSIRQLCSSGYFCTNSKMLIHLFLM